MIRKGFITNFVAQRNRSRNPRCGNRNASPRREQNMIKVNKGTLNVISGSFTLGGETSNAKEVYASQISGTIVAGKCPREVGEVVISFSDSKMKHVTFPHDDVLMITTDIDEYGLINSCNFTDVIFLVELKNMGKSEKDLKNMSFPLIEFVTTHQVGTITLPVYLGVE